MYCPTASSVASATWRARPVWLAGPDAIPTYSLPSISSVTEAAACSPDTDALMPMMRGRASGRPGSLGHLGHRVSAQLGDRDLAVVDGHAEARHERRLDVANQLLGRLVGKRKNVNLGDLTVETHYHTGRFDLPHLGKRGLDVLSADPGCTLVHTELPAATKPTATNDSPTSARRENADVLVVA